MTDKLIKANEYENLHGQEILENDRPLFHVTGTVGWINDPNGFSVYNGEYHLFYQYHPYSTHWGPMHWGHVKSKDLVKWERLPVAMAPDTSYDDFGCFSGSAIELADGSHMLMYTGVTLAKDGGVEKFLQQQCVAIGDGASYEKYENNPVISSDMLPDGADKYDFRDPKIFKRNGKYYVVTGNRAADGAGQILLFESENGFEWNFKTVLDKSNNLFGKMWECPDFFELDDKDVLMFSPQEMRAVELEYNNGNNTAFIVGNLNADYKMQRDYTQKIDYGIDFYAPQSLKAPDGRRIMIAWMQNWDTTNAQNDGIKYFGEMTFPRELFFDGDRICQLPVKEIENYYGREVSYDSVNISGRQKLDGILGRTINLELSIDMAKSDFNLFIIKLAEDDTNHSSIVCSSNGVITIDRTYSGFTKDVLHSRSFKYDMGAKLNLRILMDRHSIELFVNGGRQAATIKIDTVLSADGISFETDGNAVVDVKKHEINVR